MSSNVSVYIKLFVKLSKHLVSSSQKKAKSSLKNDQITKLGYSTLLTDDKSS